MDYNWGSAVLQIKNFVYSLKLNDAYELGTRIPLTVEYLFSPSHELEGGKLIRHYRYPVPSQRLKDFTGHSKVLIIHFWLTIYSIATAILYTRFSISFFSSLKLLNCIEEKINIKKSINLLGNISSQKLYFYYLAIVFYKDNRILNHKITSKNKILKTRNLPISNLDLKIQF